MERGKHQQWRFCLCIVEMASALATSEVWWPLIPSSMLIFSTIFLALMTLHRTSGKRRNAVHSIPGPYPWPIVGNIFQLGKEPHLVLSEMGEDFAERPRFQSMADISRGQSIVFNKPYNAEWKAYKRLAQNALRTVCSQEAENSECSCALEQHVRSEARYLGQMCIDLTAEHGAFDPTEHVTVTAGNVISAILFGRRFEHDDKEFQSILAVGEEFAKAASTENLADFIPILQYVPNVRLRKFKELMDTYNLILERNVEEHYKQDGLLKNNLANVTDSLIAMSQETKLNENVNRRISKEQVTSTVIDLFGAGFDTVGTTLNWSLLYLAKYPDIQEKMQKEIDATVDRNQFPRLTDKSSLPYTEAFILELFRHSSFLPLSVPHWLLLRVWKVT
uniref:Cytochrome P450 1A n=1 Tax=Eptatretus burgeri TaxID=7764 RepID=A0A8C4QUV9_EPTBU